MEGRLTAFIIWSIVGALFIVMGIYISNSKKAKPFGFWANAEVAPIEDVKGYNRALGILWCAYGILFTLIGAPLLKGPGWMPATIIPSLIYNNPDFSDPMLFTSMIYYIIVLIVI